MTTKHWGVDGKGSTYVEWEVADGIYKRAWVQHRQGTRDWAKTGRYVNVTRVESLHCRPEGFPADFPIYHAAAITDRSILSDFVDGICSAVGR